MTTVKRRLSQIPAANWISPNAQCAIQDMTARVMNADKHFFLNARSYGFAASTILQTLVDAETSRVVSPCHSAAPLYHRSLRAHLLKTIEVMCAQCLRYEQALALLRKKSEGAFFQKYPVLARFVASRLHLTLQSAEELSARLIKDNPALISGFGVSVEELVHVAWGLSDLHQGGRSVCRLSFGNGQSIYYKPRSMGPDKFLLAISESLGSDLRPALPAFVDRGSHGYVAEALAAAVTTEAEVQTYYFRSGVLLALCYLTGLSDLHSDNIIASGTEPIIIDCETILDPVPRDATFAATQQAADFIGVQGTVLRSGLLPFPALSGDELYDLSGLGGVGPQRSPVPSLRGPTDPVIERTKKSYRILASRRNTLYLAGKICRAFDHIPPLVSGFQNGLEAIRRAEKNISTQLRSFRHNPPHTRWVARPTAFYEKIIEGGLHPALAADAGDTDSFILTKLTLHETWGQASLIASERRQLWLGDIPAFWTSPTDLEVKDDLGLTVTNLQVSGLDAMAERLSACVDLAGTDGQLECIRLSVASDATRQLGSFGTPRPTENMASQESAFGVVEQIVKRLSDTVLETRSGLRWATLRPIKIDQYTVGLTNHTLYDGVAGILLFLSLAAEHLSLERARTLAHRLAAQLTATFDHYAPWYGAGAYDGLPGILYAVERSFPPLGIDSTHFRINCARRILDALPSEGPADVIGGVAGALLISSRVLESTPMTPAERAIWLRIGRACVDALGATAIRCGNEALWRAMIPLKDFPYGFAHGGGGIAYALETWSRLTDDGEASLLADSAARREASGYDDQLGGWVDTRTGKLANYWCYGAAGLLLPFRLLASRTDNEEWTQALSKCEGAAKNYRPQPQSCLCHGSSGIKELIGAAAETTDEGESRFSVDLGLPLGVSTPGLMTGLSGLGIYFLRRYLSPNIGSVLSLEF